MLSWNYIQLLEMNIIKIGKIKIGLVLPLLSYSPYYDLLGIRMKLKYILIAVGTMLLPLGLFLLATSEPSSGYLSVRNSP